MRGGPRYISRMRAFVLTMVALSMAMACGDRTPAQKMAQAFQSGEARPDEIPSVINRELPFRYPPALYARKIQGNVTLRLFVDADGQVHSDSTRVEESSGRPALDSAALEGAHSLRFVPAKLRGEPMATTVLFPVYFRHPEAPPLPGDTILTRRAPTAAPEAP